MAGPSNQALIPNGFIAAIPPGRTGHVSVQYEKFMLVWGGYKENHGASTNTYFSGAELWMYSCITEKWYMKETNQCQCPPGLSGSVAVIIGEALYLFGGYGYNNEGCTNFLFKLDLRKFCWEKLSPKGIPPIPVDKMVGWQHNKKLYVFGGFGNPENSTTYDFQFVFYHLLWRGWTNQFFEYDPKTDRWTTPVCTGTLPSARAAHAAAVLDNKVYIFGGRHDVYRMNDLHCLDMTTMHWSGEMHVNSCIPMGRSWHSLTALGERLLLYGGFSQDNIALSDCWMFDIVEKTWQQIELPFSKPRLWHSACLSVYDEVLVYGGCTSNILDQQRVSEQASDVIVIRISPKSLLRLCVDKLLEMLPQSHCLWNCLPHSLQNDLYLRSGKIRQRNLDGS